MASDGVFFFTSSDSILWAIYTEMHGSATKGAELESGQFKILCAHAEKVALKMNVKRLITIKYVRYDRVV